MMPIHWVKPWLEMYDGGGTTLLICAYLCMMRHKQGNHLWWIMTFGWQKSLWRQAFFLYSFFTFPADSRHFNVSVLWHCEKSFGFSESRCTLGSKDAQEEQIRKHVVSALGVRTSCTGKVTKCWAMLEQEMRHGCPLTHLSQNGSLCSGSILSPWKAYNSDR